MKGGACQSYEIYISGLQLTGYDSIAYPHQQLVTDTLLKYNMELEKYSLEKKIAFEQLSCSGPIYKLNFGGVLPGYHAMSLLILLLVECCCSSGRVFAPVGVGGM